MKIAPAIDIYLTYLYLVQHFHGRSRNCYSITIRAVHRMLQYVAIGRIRKKADLREVSST